DHLELPRGLGRPGRSVAALGRFAAGPLSFPLGRSAARGGSAAAFCGHSLLRSSAMPERLLVIGGDPGGMAAASQARRRRPDLEIVALEKGRWTSYSACGIPYVVGGE